MRVTHLLHHLCVEGSKQANIEFDAQLALLFKVLAKLAI